MNEKNRMGKKCFLVYLLFIAQLSQQRPIFIITELQLLFSKWHQFFSMWRKFFTFGEGGAMRKKISRGNPDFVVFHQIVNPTSHKSLSTNNRFNPWHALSYF